MPPVQAADVRAFAEAIRRIGDLFSLASFIPVLFECRFKLGRLKAKAGAQTRVEKQEESSGAEEVPAVPVGILSVLLFAASEAVTCVGMFMTATKVASKSKSASRLDGNLGALVEGIKKGQKTAQAARGKGKKGAEVAGSLEKLAIVVMEALNKPAAFDAAHGLTIFVALLAALLSLGAVVAWPSVKSFCRHGVPLPRWGAALAPIALVVVLQWKAVLKVWKALQGELLLPALQHPLRIAALVAAAAPVPDKVPGVPMFAALQAASLAASLSAEIANGGLARDFAPFADLKQPVWSSLLDSQIMTYLIPTLLVVVWLSLVHLRRSPGALAVAAGLSVASSPVPVVIGWRQVWASLGFAPAQAAQGLVKVLSLAYAGCTLSLVLAGGTLGIVSGMAMVQLLVRIHGHEPFSSLFD